MISAYTNYPITEFGDKPYENAPIRDCSVVSYDGDRYCQVTVYENLSPKNIKKEIKRGYLYTDATCGVMIDVSTLPIVT